jgi:dienelactone hydrolase
MQAALLLEERVAGVIALSTWLGQPPKLAGAAKTGLPLLVCHGAVDRFVPARFGREAKETLNRLGLAAIFKMYPMMGHAFCAQVPLLAPPRGSNATKHGSCQILYRSRDGGPRPVRQRPMARRMERATIT